MGRKTKVHYSVFTFITPFLGVSLVFLGWIERGQNQTHCSFYPRVLLAATSLIPFGWTRLAGSGGDGGGGLRSDSSEVVSVASVPVLAVFVISSFSLARGVQHTTFSVIFIYFFNLPSSWLVFPVWDGLWRSHTSHSRGFKGKAGCPTDNPNRDHPGVCVYRSRAVVRGYF